MSFRFEHLTNFAIYSSLWVFAAACAALPIYVHLHPDRFGPPLMTFYGASESQLRAAQLEQARSIAALLRPKLQLDQITTGSIQRPLKKTGARVAPTPSWPLPEDVNFKGETVRFITATHDRALAVVDGEMKIFVPGDRLPDGRTIARFERQGGKIVPVAADAIDDQSNPPDQFR